MFKTYHKPRTSTEILSISIAIALVAIVCANITVDSVTGAMCHLHNGIDFRLTTSINVVARSNCHLTSTLPASILQAIERQPSLTARLANFSRSICLSTPRSPTAVCTFLAQAVRSLHCRFQCRPCLMPISHFLFAVIIYLLWGSPTSALAIVVAGCVGCASHACYFCVIRLVSFPSDVLVSVVVVRRSICCGLFAGMTHGFVEFAIVMIVFVIAHYMITGLTAAVRLPLTFVLLSRHVPVCIPDPSHRLQLCMGRSLLFRAQQACEFHLPHIQPDG